MGTSSSSSGPKSGVPIDPPWLDSTIPQPSNSPALTSSKAPPRRFANARRNLNAYIASGYKESLKKALGHYSSKGMGGAKQVASRMRFSTSSGSRLFNFLDGIKDGLSPEIKDWIKQLYEGDLDASEIADEITKKIISESGVIEEDSCRKSMNIALAELIESNQDFSLEKMNEDSIWAVMTSFLAHEVSTRVFHDIGQSFEKSDDPKGSVLLMNDMLEYVKAEISRQIRTLRSNTSTLATDEINNLLQLVVERTFKVFEEDLR